MIRFTFANTENDKSIYKTIEYDKIYKYNN